MAPDRSGWPGGASGGGKLKVKPVANKAMSAGKFKTDFTWVRKHNSPDRL